MFAKLNSVGFLKQIFRSLVLHTPPLKSLNKKPEKVMCDNRNFLFAFPNFGVAKTMSIPYYFTSNVQTVYESLIAHYSLEVVNKIFRQGSLLFFLFYRILSSTSIKRQVTPQKIIFFWRKISFWQENMFNTLLKLHESRVTII